MTTESTLTCSMCTMFYMNLGNQVTVRGATEKNKGATTKVREINGPNLRLYFCCASRKSQGAFFLQEQLQSGVNFWLQEVSGQLLLPRALAGLPAELLLLFLSFSD